MFFFFFNFLPRSEFWKWLFVSQMILADTRVSVTGEVFYFSSFLSQMSVIKTGSQLQWHIMCYSQETPRCGSRKTLMNVQLVRLRVVFIICCDQKWLSKYSAERNKGIKHASAAEPDQPVFLYSIKFLLRLWSLMKTQRGVHPLQLLIQHKRKTWKW